jgi:phage replication-related protein YjqB (UPF0714/DUF867 family)
MIILLILLSLNIFAHDFPAPGSQDHYQSFSEMAEKNTEGVDYLVSHKGNLSPILVTAFHGGHIEPGTSELGRAITNKQFDFYSFDALKPGQMNERSLTSSTLHITSTRFDEPKLMSLIPKKDFCLGLHGFGGYEGDFCVGGGNEQERKKLVEALNKNFPELISCELCCPPLNGTSAKNPINRCQKKGVQVEMSPAVRSKILNNSNFKNELADVFKEYLNQVAL